MKEVLRTLLSGIAVLGLLAAGIVLVFKGDWGDGMAFVFLAAVGFGVNRADNVL